jgi:cell division protein FtsL
MRDLIKLLIALSFMVVAFFVGQYFAREEYDVKIQELNNKIGTEKEINQRLHDSITLLSNKQIVSSIDTTVLKKYQSKRKRHKQKLKKTP